MGSSLEDLVLARGWHVDLNSVDGEGLSTSSKSADDLENALLDYDLRKCGKSVLPADINGAAVGSVSGPLILQVMGFQDVSMPSKFKTGSSKFGSKNRIMVFRLTDGVRECKAIECKPLVGLKPKELLPGVKVRLEGKVMVRYGLLILNDACFVVVGGRVSSLAEAYEAKQLYGGSERTGLVAKSEDQPPRFKPFDPTRRPRKKINQNTLSQIPETAQIEKGEKNEESIKGSGIERGTHKKAPSSSKVATTLLERMEASSNSQKFGGRSHGRRGRRNHDDATESSKHMTLDEWEASKKKASLPESSIDTDYELAMELQQKFDVEECSSGVIESGFFYEEHEQGRGRGGRGNRGGHRGRGGRGNRGGHRGRGGRGNRGGKGSKNASHGKKG